MCRCGTLWLTRLLIATNVPSACKLFSMARSMRWAFWKSGATSTAGRSARVSTWALGTSRQCPGKSGRVSEECERCFVLKDDGALDVTMDDLTKTAGGLWCSGQHLFHRSSSLSGPVTFDTVQSSKFLPSETSALEAEEGSLLAS